MKTLDVITIGRASVDLYGQQVGGRLGGFGVVTGPWPVTAEALAAARVPSQG